VRPVAPSGPRDLVCIKKSVTGTGTTEIHILSSAAQYQSFNVQTGTALHPTDHTWAFCVAGNRDVYCISKTGPGSGTTEIHVLSAASGYQNFSIQTRTALHPTGDSWNFCLASNGDLFCIQKTGASGTTEVHVLSASSGYQSFSMQTKTGLHPTDGTWEFCLAPNRDLYCISKRGPGSGTTEIHVLSASSNYQHFSLHTPTGQHPTDHTFAFCLGPNNDLVAIKKSNTGTGSTEVHVLDRASGYKSFTLHTGTALEQTGASFAFGCIV
jgi:hypothetical protein